VWLASGWWQWFKAAGRTLPIADSGGLWLVFCHEVHSHWRFSVGVQASWTGSPPPEELARAATRLTVEADTALECEVFVLPDYIFLQRGPGDLGTLVPHDGRTLAELTEREIQGILRRG
jgi:hypothetical protein